MHSDTCIGNLSRQLHVEVRTSQFFLKIWCPIETFQSQLVANVTSFSGEDPISSKGFPVWMQSKKIFGKRWMPMGSSGPQTTWNHLLLTADRLQGPRTVDPSWTPAFFKLKHGTCWGRVQRISQWSSPTFFSPFIKPESVCWSFHILYPVKT